MAYAEKRGDGPFPWRVKFKKPDGSETSASGFATEEDALNHGRDQEADIRRGRWHDPKAGEITLDTYFWKKWLPAQRLSDKSVRNHKGEYRTHIAPRWGTQPLNTIDPFEIAALEKQLLTTRSASTRRNVMDLLRFMLDDAVHAKMLQHSPMLPRQRGRGQREPEKVRPGQVTTLAAVLAIGVRLKPGDALMALVTLFTGMRWGEVSGMRRSFLTLEAAGGERPARGHYVIDEKIGAVHEEQSGRRFFGPPKGNKGRTVELPAFLVELLIEFLGTFPLERNLLFVNQLGVAHNNSSFTNNHWRAACDGREGRGVVRGHAALEPWEPIHAGLWFHDLRHTHKTWLADDGIEPVARDERLGHVTPGMDGVYIHVTPSMRAKILAALQARWDDRPGS